VRGRELGRRELVEAHAARIAERNDELNAIVDLRLEAALAEAERATGSRPLDGVLITVKHNLDVAGMPTTLGVRSRADLVAERDEPAVRRPREAGAIVLGKGNMPDLAIRWDTLSSLHGGHAQPARSQRSAGGSSGGDAAAVGAGMSAGGARGGRATRSRGARPGRGRGPSSTPGSSGQCGRRPSRSGPRGIGWTRPSLPICGVRRSCGPRSWAPS